MMDYPLSISNAMKVLDSIYGTVLVVNRNRKIIFANKLVYRVLKADADKIIGTSIDSLIQDGYLINSATKEALDTQRLVVKYVRGVMDTPILTVSNPVFDPGGNLEAVVAFSIDELFLEYIVKEMVHERASALQLLDYLAQTNNLNAPVVAKSKAMKSILSYIQRISKVDSTVLLTGQSGTGKEVLAKLIHNSSRRSGSIFLPVNCAAVPTELMESEFFGYDQGAFTGASRDGKAGFFELADSGTLFLDEIGELPLSLQTKFLRVLETGEVKRLGAETGKRVNVRIVAATNRNLEVLCQKGAFREDLYYRLNVISIHIPPLVERPEDILPMAWLFLNDLNKKYGTTKILSSSAIKRIQAYDWPGNVRELRNVVERLVISSDSDILEFSNELQFKTRLGSKTLDAPFPQADGNKSLRELVSEYEVCLIQNTIRQCGGNVAQAAALLRLDKSSLYRKLRVSARTPPPQA